MVEAAVSKCVGLPPPPIVEAAVSKCAGLPPPQFGFDVGFNSGTLLPGPFGGAPPRFDFVQQYPGPSGALDLPLFSVLQQVPQQQVPQQQVLQQQVPELGDRKLLEAALGPLSTDGCVLPSFIPADPITGCSAAEQAAELAALLREADGMISQPIREGASEMQVAPPTIQPDIAWPTLGFTPPPPPPGKPPDVNSTNTAPEESVGKKRRRSTVEGLARGTAIKGGGTVTVYDGYSSIKAAPQAEEKRTETSAPSKHKHATEALPRRLPEGWEMKRSRTSGRIYFVNESLGKSQFEPPAGATMAATTSKKKKTSSRVKDCPDAQVTDKNGVMGLIRASEKKTGRWAKWQMCSRALQDEDEDDD